MILAFLFEFMPNNELAHILKTVFDYARKQSAQRRKYFAMILKSRLLWVSKTRNMLMKGSLSVAN